MEEMDCVYSYILKQLTAIEPVKSSSLYFEFVLTIVYSLFNIVHIVLNIWNIAYSLFNNVHIVLNTWNIVYSLINIVYIVLNTWNIF